MLRADGLPDASVGIFGIRQSVSDEGSLPSNLHFALLVGCGTLRAV